MALDDASAGLNGNGDGGGGEDPSKEASSSSPSTTNGGLERRSSRSSSNAGKKCIVLKSPVGGEPAVYDWPLKKGKGSVRKSEVRDRLGLDYATWRFALTTTVEFVISSCVDSGLLSVFTLVWLSKSGKIA